MASVGRAYAITITHTTLTVSFTDPVEEKIYPVTLVEIAAEQGHPNRFTLGSKDWNRTTLYWDRITSHSPTDRADLISTIFTEIQDVASSIGTDWSGDPAEFPGGMTTDEISYPDGVTVESIVHEPGGVLNGGLLNIGVDDIQIPGEWSIDDTGTITSGLLGIDIVFPYIRGTAVNITGTLQNVNKMWSARGEQLQFRHRTPINHGPLTLHGVVVMKDDDGETPNGTFRTRSIAGGFDNETFANWSGLTHTNSVFAPYTTPRVKSPNEGILSRVQGGTGTTGGDEMVFYMYATFTV